MPYRPRIIDVELDELLVGLAAISLEGPRGVGKTATAMQRARRVIRLYESEQRQLVLADPKLLLGGPYPTLIDEWQRLPQSWDEVRRAVDDDPSPSRFLLTGSATPSTPPTHSGAGRIVKLRMRPFSLAERDLDTPTVSLGEIMAGNRPDVEGQSRVTLAEYAQEIVSSGLPGIRHLTGRALRAQLDGYVSRIVDTDFTEAGHSVRRPEILRSWLAAYAAATSTTATFEAIRDAATPGLGDKPSRATLSPYREVLERIWILDPLPAWTPGRNQFSRLAGPAKHHLADPALAATLLRVGADALLAGKADGPVIPRDGTLLGSLFESLVTLSVRVYAQHNEAGVGHLRTKDGRREVDLIVERADRKVVAIEAKLGSTVEDGDVRHLLWLRDRLGPDFLDGIVVYTGSRAYRRADGIAVVPAALLGP